MSVLPEHNVHHAKHDNCNVVISGNSQQALGTHGGRTGDTTEQEREDDPQELDIYSGRDTAKVTHRKVHDCRTK
jgi:hypothetical protein